MLGMRRSVACSRPEKMMAETLYRDRWITCEADRLVLHGPKGDRIIPYSEIREVTLQPLVFKSSWENLGPLDDALSRFPFNPNLPRTRSVLRLDIGALRKPTVFTADPMKVAAIIDQRRKL